MAPPDRPLEARLAVAERTLADHDQEIELARQRYHASLSDRQAIGLLVQAVKEMPQRMEEIATKAIVIALEKRDETERKDTGVRLDRVAIAITIVGLTVSIYFNAR